MSNESQAVQEAAQAAQDVVQEAAQAVSVGWYVAAIVLFPAILMAIDAIIEYKRLEKGATRSTGISGFRRTIIALTVLLIIGIGLFILIGRGGDAAVIGNVLSMLAGVVAAISGFYFGGKVAEKPLDAAEERADAEKRAKEEVEKKVKVADERADTEKKAKEEVEKKVKVAEEELRVLKGRGKS